MAPSDDLQAEVARLRDALEAERRVSEQWRRVAEDRRVAMERLRQRRVVRLLLGLARVVLPVVRRTRTRVRAVERRARRLASGLVGARHRIGAAPREAALRRAVRSLPDPPADSRSVVAVVLTRDGRANLERLLPRLRSVRHDALEIVVVDNASGPDTRHWLRQQPGIRVIRNERNLSYAEANDRGVATSDAEVVLLLNDDVEPLDDAWLPRMLQALRGDVAAVGAQLVYPRRALLDGRARDVSVQHLGIALEPDGDGPPRAVNRGRGQDADPSRPVEEVAGATGACLVVSRAAWDTAGGLDRAYDYGAEDVDLCWRLRQAGHRVAVVPAAVLWHREGATRHSDELDARAARQARNWDTLADRFGPAMRRAVERDRVWGHGVLSDHRLHVGITITRDLESAGYGDFYTAHELGRAFEDELGWVVRYVERYRDAWYDGTGELDLLVVLHDEFDLGRVARPGLTAMAWIRNWADRWVGHPWFDDFDLVMASSSTIGDQVRAMSRRREVHVLPLATNPDRFVPAAGPRAGVVMPVNNWGVDRGVEELVAAIGDVRLYGKGWDHVPALVEHWHGHLSYDQLPDLYGRAEVVVDQAAPHTRPFASVNSRVFDALSAGALVVTDQLDGARELFGDLLPTYDGPEEAAALVRRLIADPAATRQRADELQRVVREHHTYTARARRVRQLLSDHLARPTVVVRTGAPNRREAANWGDTFYAQAMVAEFRAAGSRATMQTLDEWHDRRGRGFDVSIHLKGRSRCARAAGQVHLVWVISHPDEVDPNELEVADAVFVASSRLADHLRDRLPGTPVEVLPQATDERRFRPRQPDPGRTHDVVFVGNSRFAERPLVLAAAASDLDLAVYGANWERYLPPSTVVDRFVPNEEVPVVYSSAAVVLNDHWPDMREWGLVSNRVFDALACGACVVTDEVVGLDDLFGDAVAVATPDTVGVVIHDLLQDAQHRADMGHRGRRIVLDNHTFRHRIDTILAMAEPLVARGHGLGAG